MSVRAAAALLFALLAAACGQEATERAGTGAAATEASTGDLPDFTGDLPDIVERGTLRVLVEREPESYLPRHGAALYAERDLAARFAARHGVELELVYVERFPELLPALLEGRGDVAAANLTVTQGRGERVAFTLPIDYSRDTLVAARAAGAFTDDQPLRGTVAAREATTLLDTARRLAAEQPGLEAVAADGALGNDALIDALVGGDFDYVVQDGNVLDHLLDYRDDIVAGRALTDPRPLAWAVRPDNPALLSALNAFLAEYRLLGEQDERYVADLPALEGRRRLRMITRNNAATYFLWRGELLGFEYELGKRFAESRGMRLEVVVAPTHDELIPMLLAGQGDFVAAFLVPTEDRKDQGATFTRPYHYASEVVVGRADEADVGSLADLSGRRIAVRRSSAYWSHLAALRDAGELPAELVAAPPAMETQEIIDAVADGDVDLTVADSHLLALQMTWRDDVKGLLNLGDEQPHAWAVHPDNAALRAAMDDFIARTYRGLFYNVSYARYFENPKRLPDEPATLVAPGRISPYDELVKAYARRYGFDWRLIVAQMHQESRFDPAATSWMGAKGLLQVLPRTARELGFEDLEDPEVGIHAGVSYLDWVRDRFPKRLEPGERTWFALAGYNAGHGHVRDARRLAGELGLDADRWFDNVERAMLKLSEPEYARRARHGFVRGSEPVAYVRGIRQRFRAYVRLLDRSG